MRRLPALGVSLIVLGLAAAAGAGEEPADVDPLAALNEGNRLFRNGQIEAAIEAYRAGYSPRHPHPTLVYNLGTAHHHLGRLPQAVLWYRRAGDSEDPWLEENLWLARRSLGSLRLPPAGFLGTTARHGTLLRALGVAIAWGSLGAFFVRRRWQPWVFGVAFFVAGGLYATAAVAERRGPRPAVLVADCASSGGGLPAGTEAWVHRLDDGSFRVAGSEAVCAAEAVALVFPDP